MFEIFRCLFVPIYFEPFVPDRIEADTDPRPDFHTGSKRAKICRAQSSHSSAQYRALGVSCAWGCPISFSSDDIRRWRGQLLSDRSWSSSGRLGWLDGFWFCCGCVMSSLLLLTVFCPALRAVPLQVALLVHELEASAGIHHCTTSGAPFVYLIPGPFHMRCYRVRSHPQSF